MTRRSSHGARPAGPRVVAREPSEAEQAEKVRWLRTLEVDRTQLLVRHPFTATLALHLDLVPVADSRLPTAATDGRCAYFNIHFLSAIDDDTRRFVLAHEVWHCVAGHLARRLDRETEPWNLAADHEVNALLRADGLPVPDDAVLYPGRVGQSAETVYEWLRSRARRVRPPGVQFDNHDPWGSVAAGPVIDPDCAPRQVDDHDPRGSVATGAVIDPDYAPRQVDAAVSRGWRQMLANATSVNRQRGTLPGDIERFVDQALRPQVPWQTLLRRFVQRTYGGSRTWLPPSRRHIHRGQWLPGTRGQFLRVIVAIDTSGSTAQVMPRFLAEVRGLMQEFDRIEIDLVECDMRITRVRTLSSWGGEAGVEDELRSVRGGGGTDLRPPFELALRNPPACLVYLTDGDGPVPAAAPGFPVLWVLPDDDDLAPDWGEVVVMREARDEA